MIKIWPDYKYLALAQSPIAYSQFCIALGVIEGSAILEGFVVSV